MPNLLPQAPRRLALNQLLSLGLLVALGLLAACTAGDQEPLVCRPSDERCRWGYDPWEPTGKEGPQVPERALPTSYRIEKLLTGLDRPTQLATTPDGRLLVTQQAGAVRVVQDGRLLDEPFVSVDVYLPEFDDRTVELGLVGIAVDPRFEQEPYVYLYYSADQPRRTVIARVRDEGGRGQGIEEIFSWEAEPLCCHIGGGMQFGLNDTLFVGVGEHQLPEEAQNPDSPLGTILRINRDGTWPSDNPFDGPVFAYGLRNPYDIAIDSQTGRIFAVDNGRIGQDAVVEIKAGANYGWPGYGLAVPLEQIEWPLLFYHGPIGPSGMEFYRADALPALTGTLLFCQFHNGGALHAVTFDLSGGVAEDNIIAPGCTSDVLTGPEGNLYFLDYREGALYRIALAED